MFVLDASTLILVTKGEFLDLFLVGVKRRVAIPGEVARECCGAKKTLDALMIQKAVDESSIEVVLVKSRRLVAKLQGSSASMTRTVSMPANCSAFPSLPLWAASEPRKGFARS